MIQEKMIQLQHENDHLQGQVLDQEAMQRLVEDSKNPNTAVHARELARAQAKVRDMASQIHELQVKLVDREREIRYLRNKVKRAMQQGEVRGPSKGARVQ